ncbi:MAG: twin-arginine translocase subunit TatC [candidate division Zixibacteria bacterium HGW-Zixibacteria-1]|nr:MAG: twin-arginine translocase subunit TatC [candidate division Zixibacteria bacterium HGW-Zixibacteria-1]
MTETTDPETKKRFGRSDMPFLDHVEELRWRIIKSILAVAVVAGVSFVFAEHIFKFIVFPLGDIKLHFTEITGSFYAYLKISFYTGIIGAAPVILYQIWRFVAPGLYSKEKSAVIPFVFFASILFLGGAAFCFYVVLPYAIKFLVGYGQDVMTPIITVNSYVSFAGMMLLAFGLTFELPVIGYFLGKIGIISARTLRKGRPYALVLILVAAAILTPTPDVFSQLLLAGPMYFLYEITIILVRYTGLRKDEK